MPAHLLLPRQVIRRGEGLLSIFEKKSTLPFNYQAPNLEVFDDNKHRVCDEMN